MSGYDWPTAPHSASSPQQCRKHLEKVSNQRKNNVFYTLRHLHNPGDSQSVRRNHNSGIHVSFFITPSKGYHHQPGVSGTVGATTLSVAQLASHTHVVPNQTGRNTSGSHIDGWSWNSAINTYATGGSQPHTHDLTAGSSGASSTLPPYCSLAFVMRIA